MLAEISMVTTNQSIKDFCLSIKNFSDNTFKSPLRYSALRGIIKTS